MNRPSDPQRTPTADSRTVFSRIGGRWRALAGWFGARSTQEKAMMALIAVLLIGVVVRWTWIRGEAADAFRERIEHFRTPENRTGDAHGDNAEDAGNSRADRAGDRQR